MAFGNFTFPKVQQELGLTGDEVELFHAVLPITVRPDLLSQLEISTEVGLAVNTEKARSEFMIAPVLIELKRLAGDRLGLFSGIPLDADPERGLNGICDFVLTTSGRQLVMEGPLVAIVEAKNDNIHNGLGQCIAAMVAAQIINQREGRPEHPVHGVATTGSAWKFLRLDKNKVTIDRSEYYIDNVGKLLAIFLHIIK